MNFITLDFETATGDRDSPCEIGLTFVQNGQIADTQAWLIKPGCGSTDGTQQQTSNGDNVTDVDYEEVK